MLTLEKWYADVVAPDGSLAITYTARLVTRHGSLAAASLLTCDAGGRVVSRTFGRGARVEDGDAELRLTHPAGWRGVFTRRRPAFATTLLAEPGDGAVEWECRFPAATATVESGGASLTGCGYAEKLTVTAEPWRLPIDVLRWGRFVTPRSSVVWLSWEGPHPLTLVLRDGVPVAPATVSEGGVVAGNLQLEITGVSELRSGRITATVLKPLRALARLVPLRSLGLEETKWRGRAVLRRDGGVVDEGFTIHEVVRWPRG